MLVFMKTPQSIIKICQSNEEQVKLYQLTVGRIKGWATSSIWAAYTIDAGESTNECYVFIGKNYEDIKKKCLEQGALWEDPEFPAADKSIFYSRRPNKKFEWKRPGVSSLTLQ